MSDKNPSPVKPAARRKARRFALQAIYQYQMSGGSAADIEAQFRAANDMSKTDVSYFGELLKGVVMASGELDRLYAPFLDRPVDELDQIERAILRLASYELKNRIDVPYRVVINEAIELGKTFGASESHKYINGVLDKLAQQLRTIETRAGR